MDSKIDNYDIGDEVIVTSNVTYNFGKKDKIDLKKGERYVVLSINSGSRTFFVKSLEDGKTIDVSPYWFKPLNIDHYKKRFRKLLKDNKVKQFD